MMNILLSSRFRLACCIAWCLSWPAIAVLLLTPLPIALISRADLLGHLALFAVMTFSVISFARRRGQIIALAVLSILYGIALEFGQAYVPGRTFDVADAVANALGGIGGCLFALALLERLFGRSDRAKKPSTGSDRSSRALSERP